MSEPPPTATGGPWLENVIEAMDRPLLGLAVLAMVLDLIDLGGPAGRLTGHAVTLVMFAIDAVFVFDLALKLAAHGRNYTGSPWFLVDLLSSLPLLDTLANRVLPLRAFRFFRGFRILRIFRGLRVLRALRTIPAFERFSREVRADARSRSHQRWMNLGMIALTVGMLAAIVAVRHRLVRDYVRHIDRALASPVSGPLLDALGGRFVRPDAPAVLSRRAVVDGQPRDVYFDLRPVDVRVDQFEFFLTLGMLFSMVMFVYLMANQQMDDTQTQLRGLLSLALPTQVVENFVADPAAYTRRTRMPATILFMDFVGFTHTCELLADDPDRLSTHLEAAMDRLVQVLVRHDMIIDKFIGDAVMSFRGGPFVPGTPAEHARRAVRAAVDSIAALGDLKDPYFHTVKVGGASDDDCLIGAFGTSARLSYTVLGDGVNLAARLEPASGQCATQNLFDETTFRLCSGADEFAWRRWGRVRVAGKADPIQVYEAFASGRFADLAFIASYHVGLEAYERHDFDRARDFFRLADSQRPGGDEPSRSYAHRCEDLLLRGRPVGWEPVFEAHK